MADEPDPDAFTAYGLDQPNAVLRLHMATGDIGTVTESGEYLVEEKPEEEVTFILGNEKNEMVCYALYEGSVYTMNRFQLDVLLEADARDTAARYPVNIPFADLAELTVEQNGQRDEYRLEHNWETDENGETIFYEGWVMMSDLLDSNGEPAYVPSAETEAVEETAYPEATPAADGIVSVSNSYNNAIVYTCLAIAAGALALVAYVIIKHKAFNEKGE